MRKGMRSHTKGTDGRVNPNGNVTALNKWIIISGRASRDNLQFLKAFTGMILNDSTAYSERCSSVQKSKSKRVREAHRQVRSVLNGACRQTRTLYHPLFNIAPFAVRSVIQFGVQTVIFLNQAKKRWVNIEYNKKSIGHNQTVFKYMGHV